MHDILPEVWPWYNSVFKTGEAVASAYGFRRIETPVLEQAELFAKGIGAATDIVEKELYTLKTKGGDALALRPEGTAPIARAYLSDAMYNWPQPVKLWYFAPMFRHERPQHGRYREFWQFGIELLGDQDAIVDAELIQVFWAIFHELGLRDITLQVNSIGCSQCRPYYKKMLLNFFRPRQGEICADCRRRLKTNPLRLLDCKEERCGHVRAQAPQFIDHLCESCHNHLTLLLEFLEELGIPYFLNFYLVRGLDYYTKTIFEIWQGAEVVPRDQRDVPASPLGAQSALAAGGRYDDLIKRLGGKPTPAVGGAFGVERIVEFLREAQKPGARDMRQPRVFLVQLGILAKRRALKLFEELRKAGIPMASSFGRDSIKSQLKVADRVGVELSLIFGQQEALDNTIIVREMASGSQEIVKLDTLIPKLKERLRKKP